jgi:hypothetical protein
MKHFKSIISLLTTVFAISAVATPVLSSELNQATVRTVYDEYATQPIAKSLTPGVITSEGDRFAVVQYSNGAWALALVPRGLDVRKQQAVELAPYEARSFEAGKMVIVKILTREQSNPSVTLTANAN